MTALDLLADAVDEVANAVYTAPDFLQELEISPSRRSGGRRALDPGSSSGLADAVRTISIHRPEMVLGGLAPRSLARA